MHPFTNSHLHKGRQLLLSLLIVPFFVFSCDAVDSEREFPTSDRDKLARFNDDAFVKANPDYFEAWELALWHEGGLRPDPEEAVMFLDHREAIRNAFANDLPEADQDFTLPWVPGALIIGADVRHMVDVMDGFFRDFNQLDPGLAPDSIAFLDHEEFSEHFFFLAYFDELLNVEEMARIYQRLPDVRFTDPDYLAVWAGNPFPVYPGYVNGDFYYLFYKTTYVTERTTLVKVEPRGLQGWRAELVTSYIPGEQPPSNARDIIRQIRSDFNERFLDETSLQRVETLRERIDRVE
ncbi:MAG: hypothetical protein EA363_07195 [Balneolaceae bacterium]|nr:MAG: hypothetical protein EA363_07195 [Balneolaceae bacterium]